MFNVDEDFVRDTYDLNTERLPITRYSLHGDLDFAINTYKSKAEFLEAVAHAIPDNITHITVEHLTCHECEQSIYPFIEMYTSNKSTECDDEVIERLITETRTARKVAERVRLERLEYDRLKSIYGSQK